MSSFVVLGDQPAPRQLLRAALNDYLDHHLATTPDDEFTMTLAVRHPISETMRNIVDWCVENEIYFDVIASSARVTVDGAAEIRYPDHPFMITAVEDGYAYAGNSAVVLALVGEIEPQVDVLRALARAADSHMVIRDLAEGGLTYIKFHGDTADTTTKENATMADEAEEMTLEELVALAAEGDEEAQAAITEVCADYDIDPDEYVTWEEVGELLEAAMEGGEEEPEEEEAEEEEAGAGGWTAEALKGLTLKEVRDHAKAAGIESWKTAPRPALVSALIEGTSEEGEEEPEEAKPSKAAGKAAASTSGIDYAKLAKAIVDELASRLS